MKKIIFGILIISLLSNACSKDSSTNEPINTANPCKSITSFTVVQQSGSLVFNIVSDSNPLYYEVSYQQASATPVTNLLLMD
jgi:PBP1b-binding outer membrane lipoprotein LpoB